MIIEMNYIALNFTNSSRVMRVFFISLNCNLPYLIIKHSRLLLEFKLCKKFVVLYFSKFILNQSLYNNLLEVVIKN